MTWNDYLKDAIKAGAKRELAENNIGHMMDLYEAYDWDEELPQFIMDEIWREKREQEEIKQRHMSYLMEL